jgi:hypothetical protein
LNKTPSSIESMGVFMLPLKTAGARNFTVLGGNVTRDLALAYDGSRVTFA